MIVDSDDGFSTDSEAERELEEKAVEFVPPRKYTKQMGLKRPEALEAVGKKQQVWLIKLPQDVDVSKIKSIPVSGGEEEFEIAGKVYSIAGDDSSKGLGKDGKFTVLVPTKKDGISNFKPSDVRIARFLDVCEKVKIPSIKYNKVVVQREDVEKETGLRMRHFPTGYYIKDYTEAHEPVVPGPKSGKSSIDSSKSKKHSSDKHKRSHDEVEGSDDEGEEKDKKKKEKKDKKDKKDKKEKKDKKDKKEKKDKKKSKKLDS
ncbi:hypothetical protein PMKS-002683 [Pichia membranifaciens]|uniref:DNA-directed RNA polymerase I subunit RPA34 n=1 Tax=Pichia membranifaciens TaxID=4926 RepID=A0A1Q2YI96_9ASCO|nr:hypothetical protein PMKS-002683 [Pichia membranifaciens]